jgi:hypothetical protein
MSLADYVSVAWNATQLTVYFTVLFWTLRYAWHRVRVRAPIDNVLIAIAALAAHLCWGLIVQFVIEDTTNLQAAGASNLQIIQSKRFIKCYSAVVDTPAKWFVSQQLLFAVVVLVLWLFVQSVRTASSVGAWKFVVLGELMAISVAFPLAITHFRGRSVVALSPFVSWRTIAAFAVALASTLLTPLLDGALFKGNLFFLHVVLVLPFTTLFGHGTVQVADERHRRGRIAMVYGLIAGASMFSHLSSVLAVWRAHNGDFVSAMVNAVFSHPCQTSISLDAVLVTFLLVSTCAAIVPHPLFVFATAPFLGAAATAALFLGLRELDVIVISQPRESRERTISDEQSSSGQPRSTRSKSPSA